jgi:O-antigen/teichoic acid export membrane protein
VSTEQRAPVVLPDGNDGGQSPDEPAPGASSLHHPLPRNQGLPPRAGRHRSPAGRAGSGRLRTGRVLRGPLDLIRSVGFIDLLIAQVVPLGVSFALTLVTAAFLGPELRGVLTYLMTGALLCGALAYGSLHVPVVQNLRVGDRSAFRHGVRLVAVLSVAMSLTGLALALVGDGTTSTVTMSTVTMTGWALVGGALVVLQLFTGRVLQGLARNRQYQVTVVVQSLLYLVGSGATLLTTRSPLLVFAAWSVSVVVGVALTAFYLRRHFSDTGPWTWSGSPWGQFLRSATANNIGSIGQMVMLRADVMIVALLVGPAAAGVYGIALSLTELSLILPEVFALSVFASRARLDERRWSSELHRIFRLNAFMSVLSAVVITLAALVLKLGPLSDYEGLVTLVLIVLPGAVIAGYSRVALSALQALGSNSHVWVFGVMALALSACYVPAALLGDAVGAAVMSTVAYAATALFLHRSLRSALSRSAR